MRQTAVFAGVTFGLVAVITLAARPFMEQESWNWLLFAGLGAWVIQAALHLSLGGRRRDPKRFVGGVLIGAVARVVVLGAAVIWIAVAEHAHPLAFLFGLTGFLVAMLMIEASLENSKWYQRLGADEQPDAGSLATTEAAHR